MPVQPCAWWGESREGVGPRPWHFLPSSCPQAPVCPASLSPGSAAGNLPGRSPAPPIRMDSSLAGRSSRGLSASDFFIHAGSKFRARAVWGSSAAP